ncbi:uncharacterized protein BDV17DRAFT_63462 [Aspergillus undulatus]|uniref:uncharacterized protein n=1 Tax=Aspergillus undulatus TaxID=1810928 RepID=UPI003CCE168C
MGILLFLWLLCLKGQNPNDIAQNIQDKFLERTLIKSCVAQGPHIQFFFAPEPLAQIILPTILEETHRYGSNYTLDLCSQEDPSQGRKKIIGGILLPKHRKTISCGPFAEHYNRRLLG